MPPLQRVWDKYMAHKLLGPPQFGVIARIDAGLVLLVALGKEEKVSQCCKLYDIHLLPPLPSKAGTSTLEKFRHSRRRSEPAAGRRIKVLAGS